MKLTAIARVATPIAAAIVLLGIGTAGALFAEKPPHPGCVTARRDIDRGFINYSVGGIALPKDAELRKRAMSDYGVTVYFTGCIGMPDAIPGFSTNYQKAVRV
ncbi:MAG: hypothetical protein EAZ36_03850 [Verrucomicrobia bacterium]|nr:MAG: hypothetical protein EAZ36_03850 [Verrucomicrobiota bacterium]